MRLIRSNHARHCPNRSDVIFSDDLARRIQDRDEGDARLQNNPQAKDEMSHHSKSRELRSKRLGLGGASNQVAKGQDEPRELVESPSLPTPPRVSDEPSHSQILFNVENILDLLLPLCIATNAHVQSYATILPVEEELRSILQGTSCYYIRNEKDDPFARAQVEMLLPFTSLKTVMNFFKQRYRAALFFQLPTRAVDISAESESGSSQQREGQLCDYLLETDDVTILGFASQGDPRGDTAQSGNPQPLCFQAEEARSCSLQELSISMVPGPAQNTESLRKWWEGKRKESAGKAKEGQVFSVCPFVCVPEARFWRESGQSSTEL